MTDFKKLRVWQKAHALSLSVDRTSKRIRASQYASVRNQIFRAAVSIPANIAEGRRHASEKEFGRFLGIAISSTSELEYHLIFARDTKIIPESEFVSLLSQTIIVRKMLYALLKRLGTPAGESIARNFRDQQSPQPPAAPPPAGSLQLQLFPRRPLPDLAAQLLG